MQNVIVTFLENQLQKQAGCCSGTLKSLSSRGQAIRSGIINQNSKSPTLSVNLDVQYRKVMSDNSVIVDVSNRVGRTVNP